MCAYCCRSVSCATHLAPVSSCPSMVPGKWGKLTWTSSCGSLGRMSVTQSPHPFPPDSPNVSFTYSFLCETSSVEVPLWIGGNPALPLYFYSRCPSCPPVPFSSHLALFSPRIINDTRIGRLKLQSSLPPSPPHCWQLDSFVDTSTTPERVEYRLSSL